MRTTFSAIVLLLLVTGGGAAEAAEGSAAAGASEAIERLYVDLLDAMKNAEELGLAGRRERLTPAIDAVYDLSFMSAKVLGRSWKQLPAEDQGRWANLFRRLTISTYAHRFDGFSGERFEVTGQEEAPRETVLVRTQIVRVDGDPVELDYRMRSVDGSWRIIDVYLNGTVSELALRRSEYSGVLKRDGFEALSAAIEEKIADPGERELP